MEVMLMGSERQVRLFRNGRNQAIRIPREFELAGNEALLRKDGDRLVIEPVKRKSLLALLATWKPLREKFPDVDHGLRPADDVRL
jgi:antitoxin VapB